MEDLKKEVLINVSTVQRDVDGKSEIKAEYKGTMYRKDEVYYIFYTEYSDDGEKTADCRVKCENGFVEIKRSGLYSSRLIFEPGKAFKSIYGTPYGGMPVVVKARSVLTAIDAEGGKILLDYSMSLSGREFDNRVAIKIRPVEG